MGADASKALLNNTEHIWGLRKELKGMGVFHIDTRVFQLNCEQLVGGRLSFSCKSDASIISFKKECWQFENYCIKPDWGAAAFPPIGRRTWRNTSWTYVLTTVKTLELTPTFERKLQGNYHHHHHHHQLTGHQLILPTN
jgi:hypothetical protein